MSRSAFLAVIFASIHSSTSLADTSVQKQYEVLYSRPLPANLISQVKSLDPKGERDLVNPGKDEISTPFGLRFEGSCTKALSNDPEKRKRQLITLNGVVTEAFNRMLICRANYPELDDWFRDWIAMARRHHISCVKETSKQKNAGAWNYLGKHTVYPIDTFEKTSDSGGAIFKDGHETFALDSWTLDTLIHEIFHATRANNRIDHNDIERIPTKHKIDKKTGLDVVECNDDIAMDRVNVIASLCSGEKLSGNKQNALLELSGRMAHCPESRSCVAIFSRDVRGNIDDLASYIWNKIRPHPSGKLNLDQSRLLCARIRDRAQCEREIGNFSVWRDNSPKNERDRINFAVKISKNAELRSLQKQLRERLTKITPSFNYELPGEWLNLDPGIKVEFEALANDLCFKALFLRTPSGNYFVGGVPKNGESFNGLLRFSKANTLAGHIEFLLIPRIAEVASAERSCQKSDVPNRVKIAMNLLHSKLDAGEVVMNSNGYYQLANNIFDDHVNRIGGGRMYPEIGPAMKQLIGEALIKTTDRVLMRFHPYSKSFDCIGAGYSLQTAAEMARQGLQSVTPAKDVCP